MESCEPQTPTFTGKLTPDNMSIETPERTTMEDDKGVNSDYWRGDGPTQQNDWRDWRSGHHYGERQRWQWRDDRDGHRPHQPYGSFLQHYWDRDYGQNWGMNHRQQEQPNGQYRRFRNDRLGNDLPQ
ncbi:hypothetical protein ACOMHN_044683 [Nucella lapillus]